MSSTTGSELLIIPHKVCSIDSEEESDSFHIISPIPERADCFEPPVRPQQQPLETTAQLRRRSRIMTAAAFRTRKYSDKLLRFSKTHPHSGSLGSSTEGEVGGHTGASISADNGGSSMPSTPTAKFFGQKIMPHQNNPPVTLKSTLSMNNRSCESTDSSSSGIELSDAKSNYRIMVLGAGRTGKTSIIRQFLYDKFSQVHQETLADDMYRGEFETVSGRTIGFDIQDVSGGYVYEFPSMMTVSLTSADAFVLVFSIDSNGSWEEVARLRDIIQTSKGNQVPIVVVANKNDLDPDPEIPRESLEATVTFDWENGYVEASAKDRFNINKIFRELLQQAKGLHDFGTSSTSNGRQQVPPPGHGIPPALTFAFSRASIGSAGSGKYPRGASRRGLDAASAAAGDSASALRRRQSLPAVPAGLFDDEVKQQTSKVNEMNGSRRASRGSATGGRNTPLSISRKNSDNGHHLGNGVSNGNAAVASETPSKMEGRRSSLAVLRRESCKIS